MGEILSLMYKSCYSLDLLQLFNPGNVKMVVIIIIIIIILFVTHFIFTQNPKVLQIKTIKNVK